MMDALDGCWMMDIVRYLLNIVRYLWISLGYQMDIAQRSVWISDGYRLDINVDIGVDVSVIQYCGHSRMMDDGWVLDIRVLDPISAIQNQYGSIE